jgi:hypothetical protein
LLSFTIRAILPRAFQHLIACPGGNGLPANERHCSVPPL